MTFNFDAILAEQLEFVADMQAGIAPYFSGEIRRADLRTLDQIRDSHNAILAPVVQSDDFAAIAWFFEGEYSPENQAGFGPAAFEPILFRDLPYSAPPLEVRFLGVHFHNKVANTFLRIVEEQALMAQLGVLPNSRQIDLARFT